MLVEVIGTPKRLMQAYSQATGETPDDIVYDAVRAYVEAEVTRARQHVASGGSSRVVQRIASIRLPSDREATP